MATLAEAYDAKAEFVTRYWALDSSPLADYIVDVVITPDHQGWGAALRITVNRPLPPELNLPDTFNDVPLIIHVAG